MSEYSGFEDMYFEHMHEEQCYFDFEISEIEKLIDEGFYDEKKY